MPVFAALDGVVSAVLDGLPDESRGGANPGPIRDVVSAGLSDVLSRDHGPATCSVTPSDGKLDGPEASAAAR